MAVYSLLEVAALAWEIPKSATIFPQVLQVWFDFGHDQIFAYLLLSTSLSVTALAQTLSEGGGGDTCRYYGAQGSRSRQSW
ncbi:unnamed protein product [Linum trigynum]|uniref:CASP-like protein n=1 Tax=Linum trigynum TaxID=586398 RepID=A0AAV2CI50_9ROSI